MRLFDFDIANNQIDILKDFITFLSYLNLAIMITEYFQWNKIFF